jgi:hypothetical protein
VTDVTDRVIPDDVKLMKGFTIQLVRKRTDMGQMSMRELIHFVFCRGSFRACCILRGVPLVEDGVATYRCLFLISQSHRIWGASVNLKVPVKMLFIV